jgi:phthiocerol/phenolphthiocerol synthesis type-I polyketide synthase C
VDHGVRNLALLSRRGSTTLEAQLAIHELEAAGARVLAMSVDVADEAQLSTALSTIRETLPPLEGVFHAAMVLDDAMVLQLSPNRMETVLAPKAWGAWNLHKLTRDDPLKHFVMFSSATTVFGNPGQANYVAACTFLDQLAHHRRATGRPALSIGWGAIADVGYLSQNQDVLRHLEERLGFKPLPAATMLGFLDKLIPSSQSQTAVAAVNWSQFSPSKFAVAATPRMVDLIQKLATTSTDLPGTTGCLRDALAAAPPEKRRGLLTEMLRKAVASVLGTAPDNVPLDQSLLAMGLDSLMAVELQMGLSRELQFEVSPMQLLRGPTIQELTEELLAHFGDG